MPRRRDPERVRARRLSRRIGAVGAALLLAPAWAGWVGNGDSLARQQADDVIGLLSRGLSHTAAPPRQADYLAARLLAQSGGGYDWPEGMHVGVLSWTGNSGAAGGAQIEVRLIAHVDETPADRGAFAHTAGSTIECWRLTVTTAAPVRSDRIRCPVMADRVPHPAPLPPLPALPPDAESLLRTALVTATPESVGSVVRDAFPGPGLSVMTLARDGWLYAAVGVRDDSTCLLGNRDPSGAVLLFPGPLESYENCSTDVFFEPSLTG